MSKSNLLKNKCLPCNEDYSNKLDEKLEKYFKDTFSFLMMILIDLFCYKKAVYPYEYMDH